MFWQSIKDLTFIFMILHRTQLPFCLTRLVFAALSGLDGRFLFAFCLAPFGDFASTVLLMGVSGCE